MEVGEEEEGRELERKHKLECVYVLRGKPATNPSYKKIIQRTAHRLPGNLCDISNLHRRHRLLFLPWADGDEVLK